MVVRGGVTQFTTDHDRAGAGKLQLHTVWLVEGLEERTSGECPVHGANLLKKLSHHRALHPERTVSREPCGPHQEPATVAGVVVLRNDIAESELAIGIVGTEPNIHLDRSVMLIAV